MYVSRGLGSTTVTLKSGRSIDVDPSKQIADSWSPPWYCYVGPIAMFSSACDEPSMKDLYEAASLTDLGAAATPAMQAALAQQSQQTWDAQCAQNPESCQIASSTSPVLTSVELAAAQVTKPVTDLLKGVFETTADIANQLKCGLFKAPEQQADGSYLCGPNYWLIGGAVAAGMVVLLVLSQGVRGRR